MENNLTTLLQIPSIKESRNYWMVRTNSGDYYDDFSLHQYIAIAWDAITLSILNTQEPDKIKLIIESSEKATPTSTDFDDEADGTTKGKITSIFNKLHRFVFEIKEGDIVLIPNKNSERILIAEVIGPAYEDSNYIERYLSESPDTEILPCPYYKRRKIKGLKVISKSSMDIYLAKGFNCQHALSSLNEYSSYIDRTIYPIYTKGNETHSTIHAGHPNGLSLKELSLLINYLDQSIEDISKQCEIDYDTDQIGVKLNFHSPGLIELIGYGASAGIAISIVMFALNNLINGGTFKLSCKREKTGLDFTIESQSDGIKGSIRKDRELDLKEKEVYIQLAKDLDIKSPEIIAGIMSRKEITPDMISKVDNSSSLIESENPVNP